MIVFDEKKHLYSDESGPLIGVSTAIKQSGMYNFDGIASKVVEYAGMRGSMVHAATELFDNGILDWGSLDPVILPYVEAYREFIEQNNVQILGMETVVCDKVLRYAGRLDRTCIMSNYQKYVLDIKTAYTMPFYTGLQLAAYRNCFDMHGRTYGRLGLQLKKDGSYKLHEYKDPEDFTVFAACLKVYQYKIKNGVLKYGE